VVTLFTTVGVVLYVRRVVIVEAEPLLATDDD
jgi:hypothetical protein